MMWCRSKFFRAEKGTPNANAVRVLIPGVAFALLLMIAPSMVMSAWDLAIRDRPWLVSELQVVENATVDGMPVIKDDIRIDYPVFGVRNVWSEDLDSVRLCGTDRSDGWGRNMSRTWSWEGFFENKCSVPARPFRVCTSFHLFSPRGVDSNAGPYCSALAANIPTGVKP